MSFIIKKTTTWIAICGIAVLSMTAHGTPAYSQEFIKANFNDIVEAIFYAEGGHMAKKPFGILSVDCGNYDECRQICLNTVRNNYERWQDSGKNLPYLEFLAIRYAPIGAKNDPKGLNRHWLKNVRYFLNKQIDVKFQEHQIMAIEAELIDSLTNHPDKALKTTKKGHFGPIFVHTAIFLALSLIGFNSTLIRS